jgi:hypothetical protein
MVVGANVDFQRAFGADFRLKFEMIDVLGVKIS